MMSRSVFFASLSILTAIVLQTSAFDMTRSDNVSYPVYVFLV